ncbi:MAG: hypothetical protein GDA48_02825 [Hormoscilla sp. GM102CHS1]|nr:hypothetical protein [Hormoscilla sp. GM102CHS1]
MPSILALDQSLRRTGVAVLPDTTSYTVIHKATFTTPIGLDLTETIEQHRLYISRIIHYYSIEHLFIEDVYPTSVAKNLYVLKEWYKWYGRYYLNLKTWVLSPRTTAQYSWTRALGILSTKQSVKHKLWHEAKIECEDADQADAIGILLGGIILAYPNININMNHLRIKNIEL